MATFNIPFSLVLYAVLVHAEGFITELMGPVAGVLLTWVGAVLLISAAWLGSGAVLAPLWHILLVAGTLGVTAYYVPELLEGNADLPAPVAQMHILLILVVTPMVVAGGPLARWMVYRYR